MRCTRIVNLCISDTHFGARLTADETGSNYGPKEQRARLMKVVKATTQFKVDYRSQTRLIIHLLGDVIDNCLHDARAGAPMATQVTESIQLLAEAINYLAKCFSQVDVYCVSGNHDRLKDRHHDRAIKEVWDSWGTVIYTSIEIALTHIKNVNFHIPKTPFYEWDSFGKVGFGCHGSSVLTPGNPGKSINVGKLRSQVNEINAVRHHDLFICGHCHVASISHLPNGVSILTNGALIPSDEYAISLGILASGCGQMLWESTPEFILGDCRFLRV